MEKVDYYESKKLAQCFITELNSSIKLPSQIYDSLKPLGQNVVAVIPGDSKKLSVFLTDASQILFVRLILDKASLNENFFTSLRKTLKDLGIENLFSTGLCFKDEICVWEGVFEYDDDDNFPEVKEKMSQVTHVNKVKFDIIKVED